MDISQSDLLVAIESAHAAEATTPAQLTGYVFGYLEARGEHTQGTEKAQESNDVRLTITLPDTIETEGQVHLPWPDGTKVRDTDGDVYVRRTRQWEWIEYADGEPRENFGEDDAHWLEEWLPATVLNNG